MIPVEKHAPARHYWPFRPSCSAMCYELLQPSCYQGAGFLWAMFSFSIILILL